MSKGNGTTTRRPSAAMISNLMRHVVLAGPQHDVQPVTAPFSGELLANIPVGTVTDVQLAVQRARAAQRGWARQPVSERGDVLMSFHDLLLERREAAMDLIQLESGKARRHALEEILDTALVARHYGLHAEHYLRTRRRQGALPGITMTREYRRPVGVVGVIAPWNFPLILGITDVLAALAAGNAVVLRPDEQSTLTALWAVGLLYEAGLPHDLLLVVTGPGPVVGPALVDAVDYVMFTGSTRTGRQVATQAAARLRGFSLELGGKNPMLVLEDADVDAAVDGAVRGAFVGAGQVCVSIERIYVHESVYEDFVDGFVERVKDMKLSTALDYDADMGSMTVQRQFDAVDRHVRDAVAKGARLLTGGTPLPELGPLFYAPTVFENVTSGMMMFAEETFGPVVAVYRVKDDDDAVARANDTPYGLNASVWSRSIRHAVRVARRIEAATVNVNESYGATWTATSSPIGGMKDSGMGRRHGAEGILKYTEAQTIAIQRGIALAPPPMVPERMYSALMPRLLGVMRHIPWLR